MGTQTPWCRHADGSNLFLTAEGFSLPALDQAVSVQQAQSAITAYAAIRGREQQLIDFQWRGTELWRDVRNMINGISDINPLRSYYIQQSINLFGALPDNSLGVAVFEDRQLWMAGMREDDELEYAKMKQFPHFIRSDISRLRTCRPRSCPSLVLKR